MEIQKRIKHPEMDGILSNLKKLISKTEEESRPRNLNRVADVRDTMAKTDPDNMVDADEMIQLAGVTPSLPKLDDIKPRQSKNEVSASSLPSMTNPISAADATDLSVLKKPSNAQAEERVWEDQQEEHKGNEFKNPLEDDIFIYYD